MTGLTLNYDRLKSNVVRVPTWDGEFHWKDESSDRSIKLFSHKRTMTVQGGVGLGTKRYGKIRKGR